MKRSALSLLCAVSLLFAAPLAAFAAPEDFQQDVEEEESRNRAERGENGTETEREVEGGSGEASQEDSENPFLALMYEITVLAWRVHNNAVFYTAYPYAQESAPPVDKARNFIHYDVESVYVGDGLEVGYNGPRRKRHWFELYSGGLATADGSYGALASFQGRFFPFFGPDIDSRFTTAGNDYLAITTAGLDFSLIQHDYFTWSFYGKGAFFRGVLERNGAAFGSQFHSFLAPPVSVHARAGAMVFENIAFGQLEGRLAVHLGRFTLFGGGMLLQSENAQILSAETGVGMSF